MSAKIQSHALPCTQAVAESGVGAAGVRAPEELRGHPGGEVPQPLNITNHTDLSAQAAAEPGVGAAGTRAQEELCGHPGGEVPQSLNTTSHTIQSAQAAAEPGVGAAGARAQEELRGHPGGKVPRPGAAADGGRAARQNPGAGECYAALRHEEHAGVNSRGVLELSDTIRLNPDP